MVVEFVSIEQKTKDKLITNLSPSASAMLSQFIELKGGKVIASEVEFAQVHTLEVMGRLDRESKIELKKHLSKE